MGKAERKTKRQKEANAAEEEEKSVAGETEGNEEGAELAGAGDDFDSRDA